MPTPAVLFGGPAPEHDISILTGLQACRSLADSDGRPAAIYWAKSGGFFSVAPDLEAQAFVEGVPAGATPLELVAGPGGGFAAEGRFGRRRALDTGALVNCCHGGPGEDGTIQAVLDLAGVRYTGPSVAGASLGMDKLAFTAVVQSAGVPTLPKLLLTPGTTQVPFDSPFIVKPRFGGSSIGIEIVEDLGVATDLGRSSPHLAGGAVIEPYREDAVDLEISIRSWPELQISPIARPLNKGEGRIYGYTEKYVGGEGMASSPKELPARLPAAIEEQIRTVAVTVADLALVRGVARLDFLWAGDDVYVNEINTIPGSLSWYLWAEAGVSRPQLLQDLIAEATAGPTRTFSTEGADGTVLRSAGSIAAKLA